MRYYFNPDQDYYSEALPYPSGATMGPDGPCHTYLKNIKPSDWNNRK